MKQQGTFEEHLRKSNLSENTITSYLWTVEYYHAHYDGISKENLLAYNAFSASLVKSFGLVQTILSAAISFI